MGTREQVVDARRRLIVLMGECVTQVTFRQCVQPLHDVRGQCHRHDDEAPLQRERLSGGLGKGAGAEQMTQGVVECRRRFLHVLEEDDPC